MPRPRLSPDRALRALLAAVPVLAVGLVTGRSFAWRQGPPPDRVGACSFGPTCRDAGCHSLVGSPTLTWDLHLEGAPGALPSPYVPGATYDLRLDVRDTGPAVIWGFELAPIFDCPLPNKAGDMVAVDPGRVRGPFPGDRDVMFLSHACTCPIEDPACCGYVPELVAGENGWSFRWTAPPRGTGQVAFDLAINAANWDGTPAGDVITVGEALLDEEPCPPPIDDLRVRLEECDPLEPSVRKVGLTWTPAGLPGQEVVRTTADRLELAAARETWALAGGSCLDTDGAPLRFYSVAPRCDQGSEGEH